VGGVKAEDLLLEALRIGLNDLERALKERDRERATKAVEYVRYHLAYLELLLPYL
jgi:hypothetical protein